MCGFGGNTNNYNTQELMLQEAEAARADEEARKKRIKEGMTKLDEQFAQFNDDFYGDRKSAYLDYYSPQIEDQYGDAKDALTFAFGRSGTLNSTMAADQFGKLLKDYEVQKGALASQADADVTNFKTRIAGEKSSLAAQLNATGDADRVSNEALGRAQVLFNERPAYNPLGDIFTGIGNGIGNYAAWNRENQIYNQYFGGGGSSAASRVVN